MGIKLLWELSYQAFEYYTQRTIGHSYDWGLIFIQSFLGCFTVMSYYVPLLRYKFAYDSIEFCIHFLISIALITFALFADFNWYWCIGW
eukprot:UN25575